MSEMANASLVFLSSMLMVGSMVMLLIPVAPVTLLLAVIASLAGLFTNFDPITVPTLLVIWALALVGASAEAWLPYFGLRGEGVGCLGIVAFFVGVFVGGLLIPVPIVGSFLGGVAGVIAVQMVQARQLSAALRGGGQALKFLLLATLSEGFFSLLILLVWFIAIATNS